MQLGLRYLDLTYAFHSMRLEERDDEAWLTLEEQAPPEDLRSFLLERDVSGALVESPVSLWSACCRSPTGSGK